MADRIRADYEELAQIAQAFGSQADGVRSLLQTISQQKQELESGQWIGKSADKFYKEMNTSVIPTVKRLGEALSRAQQVTQQISRIMKDAENASAALFRLTGSGSAFAGVSGTVSGAGVSLSGSANLKSGGGGVWGGVKDFFGGMWDEAKDMAKGLWHIVTDPIGTAKGLWHAITHPGELWDAFKKPYVEAWESGHPWRAIGRGVFFAASFALGAKGVDKVGKAAGAAGKVGEVAGTAGKVGEVAGTAGKVGEVAGTAGKVGEVAGTAGKVGEVAGGAGKVGEVAGGAGKVGEAAGAASKGGEAGVAASVAEQQAALAEAAKAGQGARVGEGAATAGKTGETAGTAGKAGEAGDAAKAAGTLSREERLAELAVDPAHKGVKPTPKMLQEAEAGLKLEETGHLKGPITRDPTGAAEFIDSVGQKWDVKAFNSNFPPKKGGFSLERDLGKIESEIAKGENVILDTSNLKPEHLNQLRQAITDRSLADKIKWYPPELN